MRLISPDRS